VAVNIAIFVTGAMALALHLVAGAGDRPGHGRVESASRVTSEAVSHNPPSGRGF
jgi:hypothetical protein